MTCAYGQCWVYRATLSDTNSYGNYSSSPRKATSYQCHQGRKLTMTWLTVLSVLGCRLTVLSVLGCRLNVLSVLGCRLNVLRCRLSVLRCRFVSLMSSEDVGLMSPDVGLVSSDVGLTYSGQRDRNTKTYSC